MSAFEKLKRELQPVVNIYHWLTSIVFVALNGWPTRRLKIVGVTGTDGKTTTAHLIYAMLKAGGHKTALISTVAAYIGDQEIDIGLHVTNPDATRLQPLLRAIADRGFSHLVLEVTSHGLDQNRLVGTDFFAGVITNITHEHLDYHWTMDKYREAKAKLILNAKYSILNKDDPNFRYLKSRAGGEVVPFGPTKIEIANPALAGEYNRYNIGAAETVAQIVGVPPPTIRRAVRDFAGVPGRMEEVRLGQPFRAIVDFAHTPNALDQVLRELSNQLTNNHKLILVFGCASERDIAKRPVMGRIAARLVDRAIVTAEDPRRESLAQIYADITSRIASQGSMIKKIVREDDRAKAIELAVKMARPGDMVVATGKGHEKSMNIGGVEYPWSDREAIEKAIRKLGRRGDNSQLG